MHKAIKSALRYRTVSSASRGATAAANAAQDKPPQARAAQARECEAHPKTAANHHRTRARQFIASARAELLSVKNGEYAEGPKTRLFYADNYLEQAEDLFALADRLEGVNQNV